MKIINKTIDSLIFAEYNPRQLTEEQYQQLKDSITRFGLVDPIIVNQHQDRKNIIVGGHQRTRVAKKLGIEEVPCVFVNLPYEKERELNVRLNKNTGGWDYDILADMFELDELIDWGFKEEELVGFDADIEVEGNIDDDQISEEVEPVCKLGDIWELGSHRIICEDATIIKNINLLMDGQKADMVFTDPPYALFGNSTGVSGITDDKMAMPFFREILTNYKKNTKLFAHIYVCCDWHSAFAIESASRDAKLTPKNLCIWDKGDGGLGAMYQQCYEMIWFFGNSPIKTTTSHGQKRGERTVNGKSNIWRYPRVTGSGRLHNAQKPVGMIENAIKNSANAKGLCLDFFLGSGSTLIACEKTNRVCYGMELDPHYCDVIINRWEQYTGKKARLVNGTT